MIPNLFSKITITTVNDYSLVITFVNEIINTNKKIISFSIPLTLGPIKIKEIKTKFMKIKGWSVNIISDLNDEQQFLDL